MYNIYYNKIFRSYFKIFQDNLPFDKITERTIGDIEIGLKLNI